MLEEVKTYLYNRSVYSFFFFFFNIEKEDRSDLFGIARYLEDKLSHIIIILFIFYIVPYGYVFRAVAMSRIMSSQQSFILTVSQFEPIDVILTLIPLVKM